MSGLMLDVCLNPSIQLVLKATTNSVLDCYVLILQIPCVLQWWDVLSRQYVDYVQFGVSENEACQVVLPEVGREYNPAIKCAAIWRVLIQQPGDTDLHKPDAQEEWVPIN